ncbi:hypothetical protein UFOVP685_58 [uncultured Caudovirales phage]|uniref:Uncharacterized protein n=1 Tax=uncultured Caudovirales phage TaxID=2100421 RepID=A0A6J5NL45_9CAUD|nr:hypothetical protein UFOVP590_26 [uncultured Caudovirales phage]CAB4157925.1 hypothetical protein UFOVP685_58 [uncultured Caudovirales phage]CAB5225619.1 hypothetical protein UFOVP750_55 [uncultured Caudovirales phage]
MKQYLLEVKKDCLVSFVMNDFTKLELEGMFLSINHSSWIYKADKHIVLAKIQSLITNYCEHHAKETIQTSGNGSVFQNRCKKCRRIV